MTLLLQTVYVQMCHHHPLTGNRSRDNGQKYCTYQEQLDPKVEKTALQMGKRAQRD